MKDPHCPLDFRRLVIGDPTNTAAWINYWPHGVPYAYTLGNGVTHAASFNHQLQQSESYDALNNTNDSTHMSFVSCLNWGDTAHPVITDKCSFPSSSADNGNLLQADEAFGGPAYAQQALGFHQAFSYDGLNRLTSVADNGGWTRSFNYDAYGNLWEGGTGNIALAGNTPQSNVYNAHNQIGLDCTQPGTSYDCAGNLLVANGNTLTYNANGQVVSTTGTGIGTVTYLYDGNGNRVAKQTSAGTTLYVYDAQGQLAAEYSSVAQSAPQCGTCYLSVDHLGSTRLITDATGNVISRHDFLPFGEEIGPNQGGRDGNFGSGADAVNQKFTGRERDSESQLDYFGARYYGSALGRFTSPDEAVDTILSVPLPYAALEDPQSLTLYSYTRNNPLLYTDSDGNDYRICVANGIGGQQCITLSDDQYKQLYNQQNGKQGVNLPGGLPGGNITCGGSNCGSVTFTENSLYDPLPGIVASAMLGQGAGLAFRGIGTGLVAGLPIRSAVSASSETAGQAAVKVLLNDGGKQAAKEAIEGLAEGAQKASAKRAVAAATKSESISITQAADGTLSITRTRPGFDGSQTFTKTISPSGVSSTVQTANDAAGNLLHYDPEN